MRSQGYSSVGRVLVSKTMGRGFESFCPCHEKTIHVSGWFFQLNPSASGGILLLGE